MYKLLIVDDEYYEIDALKFIITNNCPQIKEIECASNGKEAIAKASLFLPDIAFLDIKMPVISGIDAAEKIKQFHPSCKIVFLTAYDYFDYAQKALKMRVEDYIVKPALNEEIIQMVNKLIKRLEVERVEEKQNREMQNKLEQITKCLESDFISSLARGELESDGIKEYLSLLNVDFNTGFTCAISIDFNSYPGEKVSSMQKGIIKRRCMDKLKIELEERQVYCLMSSMNDGIYLLLITKNHMDIDNIRRWSIALFHDIYLSICEKLNVKINIGIGSVFNSIEHIQLSFSQAKIALKYRIKEINSQNGNRSHIIHFDDIELTDNDLCYPIEKEKILCEKIMSGNHAQAIMLAEDIFDWIIQNSASIEYIKRKVYELIVVMYRAASEKVNYKENKITEYYNELQYVSTIGDIRIYIQEVLKSIIQEVGNIESDRAGILIDKVCKYINEHYMEEIVLDDMGKMTGFSSYYFSKLFKQYRGINFSDYIISIRIDKAKQLLRDPTKSVKEVGDMVGYYSPNYFTRIFKKVEGITPTEYRDNIVLS